MVNWKVTGDQGNSFSFELGVVEVDSEILNGGLFALKSSLKSHFISF